MVTPNQAAIPGFLKQVDAGHWQETDQVPEGGWLMGRIASVNRGPTPRPIPCGAQELSVLKDAGYIMAGEAPNTFIISESGEDS